MRFVSKLIAILVIVLIPANAFAAPEHKANCTPVKGIFVGQAVPTDIGFDVYIVSLTGEIAGQPVGDKITTVTVKKVTPSGATLFTGSHHIQSATLGELVTADHGVILPNGHIKNLLKIVEGGSGLVNVSGTLDSNTGIAAVDYWGRVCTN